MADAKYPFAHKCKKCGREIFPTASWSYKRGSKYYCSWKCLRADEKPKPKLILPQVGDTIRILLVSGIPKYTNREGVVEFYDCFGQLHGTWGDIVIVPGEDIYEIIGEKENE